MPDRIIRESAFGSETLGHLGDFTERLFWRLTVAADDFGRFNANPNFIFGRCMALVVKATTTRVKDALEELRRADTIRFYEVEGRIYGFFPSWQKYQQTRAKKSKYPDPPASADKCLQMLADENICSTPVGAPNTNTNTNTNTKSNSYSEDFERFWQIYPRREGKQRAAELWDRLGVSDRALALADVPKRTAANWSGKDLEFIPHASTYLNKKRWQDELTKTQAVSPYGPPRPRELVAPISEEQRRENMRRLRELTAGIGK